MSSTDPDELYTLRAQYWLGHYQLAIEEARSVARRPMSPALKIEREEFLQRSYLALGQYDKVIHSSSSSAATDTSPGLQALAIKARFDAAHGQESVQATLCDQVKSLVGGGSAIGGNGGHSSTSPSAQLIAAQLLLAAGQVKEALQCVHHNATPEQSLLVLQIYLKLDRLDLARQQVHLLKQVDEDSILAQLASVYVGLASGSTGASDAIHSLNSLSEQYGPSPYLLNLMACALLQQGDYAGAEQKLQECMRDHSKEITLLLPDTLLNLINCSVQQGKPVDLYVQQLQQQFPTHPFCAGLARVTSAFEREAIKYKV